jgi:hypothetical protein
LTVKVKLAEVWFVRLAGPVVIVTVGGVESRVQFQVAGADVLPAASVAVTTKVCAPSGTPEYEMPETQLT